MMYEAAFTEDIHVKLSSFLIRKDRQEDLCFALWKPSTGKERFTGIIKDFILPEDGDRNVHGNVSFNPSFFERVLGLALKNKCGIAFLHSHPFRGWQDMSDDDIEAESKLASRVFGATGLPLLGMTIGSDKVWSSRFWFRLAPKYYDRIWCQKVRVIGKSFQAFYNEDSFGHLNIGEELQRTVSSWGESKQVELSRMCIGVIGVGSVGSIVAETLTRIGIGKIKLIDFDKVEKKNIDRLLNVERKHIGKHKVNLISEQLLKHSPLEIFSCDPIMYSVIEEEGYRNALDCDILFSCVDRPWPRFVLNLISHAHLIPVIDGGIHVNSPNKRLKGADWKTHLVSPSHVCLECLGQYNPADVTLERDGYLDDPNYINGLKDSPIGKSENVFAFSLNLAALEIQQLLSYVISPSGISYIQPKIYHFVTGTLENNHQNKCKDNCLFKNYIAIGDEVDKMAVSRHLIAEQKRKRKANIKIQVKV